MITITMFFIGLFVGAANTAQILVDDARERQSMRDEQVIEQPIYQQEELEQK